MLNLIYLLPVPLSDCFRFPRAPPVPIPASRPMKILLNPEAKSKGSHLLIHVPIVIAIKRALCGVRRRR